MMDCFGGGVLQCASDTLKADREVVLEALRLQKNNNALALWYASDALKADRKFIMAAVRQNGNALKYVMSTVYIRVSNSSIFSLNLAGGAKK